MLARGAGLHAMDGGAIGAAVSACGLTALLELATAIAKGYNSPLRRAHSMLLWSVALPLHAPENFGPTWQFSPHHTVIITEPSCNGTFPVH